MTPDEKKEWACQLLRQKSIQLGRLPKKEDFEEATRSRIKAYLGPWPRGLEAAGLKEPKPNAFPSKKSKERTKKPVSQPACPKEEKTQ